MAQGTHFQVTVAVKCNDDDDIRTVTFHALVYQPVEERATVVTERRARVRVDLKLVFAAGILGNESKVNLNNAVFYL